MDMNSKKCVPNKEEKIRDLPEGNSLKDISTDTFDVNVNSVSSESDLKMEEFFVDNIIKRSNEFKNSELDTLKDKYRLFSQDEVKTKSITTTVVAKNNGEVNDILKNLYSDTDTDAILKDNQELFSDNGIHRSEIISSVPSKDIDSFSSAMGTISLTTEPLELVHDRTLNSTCAIFSESLEGGRCFEGEDNLQMNFLAGNEPLSPRQGAVLSFDNKNSSPVVDNTNTTLITSSRNKLKACSDKTHAMYTEEINKQNENMLKGDSSIDEIASSQQDTNFDFENEDSNAVVNDTNKTVSQPFTSSATGLRCNAESFCEAYTIYSNGTNIKTENNTQEHSSLDEDKAIFQQDTLFNLENVSSVVVNDTNKAVLQPLTSSAKHDAGTIPDICTMYSKETNKKTENNIQERSSSDEEEILLQRNTIFDFENDDDCSVMMNDTNNAVSQTLMSPANDLTCKADTIREVFTIYSNETNMKIENNTQEHSSSDEVKTHFQQDTFFDSENENYNVVVNDTNKTILQPLTTAAKALRCNVETILDACTIHNYETNMKTENNRQEHRSLDEKKTIFQFDVIFDSEKVSSSVVEDDIINGASQPGASLAASILNTHRTRRKETKMKTENNIQERSSSNEEKTLFQQDIIPDSEFEDSRLVVNDTVKDLTQYLTSSAEKLRCIAGEIRNICTMFNKETNMETENNIHEPSSLGEEKLLTVQNTAPDSENEDSIKIVDDTKEDLTLPHMSLENNPTASNYREVICNNCAFYKGETDVLAENDVQEYCSLCSEITSLNLDSTCDYLSEDSNVIPDAITHEKFHISNSSETNSATYLGFLYDNQVVYQMLAKDEANIRAENEFKKSSSSDAEFQPLQLDAGLHPLNEYSSDLIDDTRNDAAMNRKSLKKNLKTYLAKKSCTSKRHCKDAIKKEEKLQADDSLQENIPVTGGVAYSLANGSFDSGGKKSRAQMKRERKEKSLTNNRAKKNLRAYGKTLVNNCAACREIDKRNQTSEEYFSEDSSSDKETTSFRLDTTFDSLTENLSNIADDSKKDKPPFQESKKESSTKYSGGTSQSIEVYKETNESKLQTQDCLQDSSPSQAKESSRQLDASFDSTTVLYERKKCKIIQRAKLRKKCLRYRRKTIHNSHAIRKKGTKVSRKNFSPKNSSTDEGKMHFPLSIMIRSKKEDSTVLKDCRKNDKSLPGQSEQVSRIHQDQAVPSCSYAVFKERAELQSEYDLQESNSSVAEVTPARLDAGFETESEDSSLEDASDEKDVKFSKKTNFLKRGNKVLFKNIIGALKKSKKRMGEENTSFENLTSEDISEKHLLQSTEIAANRNNPCKGSCSQITHCSQCSMNRVLSGLLLTPQYLTELRRLNLKPVYDTKMEESKLFHKILENEDPVFECPADLNATFDESEDGAKIDNDGARNFMEAEINIESSDNGRDYSESEIAETSIILPELTTAGRERFELENRLLENVTQEANQPQNPAPKRVTFKENLVEEMRDNQKGESETSQNKGYRRRIRDWLQK